jgi:predicted CopG family antitoxin
MASVLKELAVRKKMTITMDEAVYERLVRVVGRRKISAFIESLARPHVVGDDLAAGYMAMAQDTQREQEALEWSEALIADGTHAAR